MRRIQNGTQIKTQTDLGEDFAIILEHRPSQYSKDIYLVRWGDSHQTLFEITKENVPKSEKKAKSRRKKTN